MTTAPSAYTRLKFAAAAAGYQARCGLLTEDTLTSLQKAAESLPEHEELAATIAGFANAFSMRHINPEGLRQAGQRVCETVEHLNHVDVGDQIRRVSGE
ncbi:hypothetical protein [Pseudooceanicola sp.]|uniref:hypothetical protein n=1 Tax=Pseudooceanicola sp. TaxID=1914328 RepID=UPI004058555C